MPDRAPVTPADASSAAYLQSLVLAVIDLYDRLQPLLGDTTKPAATRFQSQHRDHAAALGKLAGTTPAKAPNATLALVLTSRLTAATDERSALTVALGVENQLTETFVAAFTTVTSPDVVRLLATIVPVAASRAAGLASLLGATTAAALPNGALEGTTLAGTDNTDIKLGFDPASFPVG